MTTAQVFIMHHANTRRILFYEYELRSVGTTSFYSLIMVYLLSYANP